MPAWQRAQLLIDADPQRSGETFRAVKCLVALDRATSADLDAALARYEERWQWFLVRADVPNVATGNRIRLHGEDWLIRGTSLEPPRGTFKRLRCTLLNEPSTLVDTPEEEE